MTSGPDHQYELESFSTENIPPFHFQKRYGEINWRKLSSIDLDRVVRELDFVTLQENISAVTFCNVDAVGDVDPLFAKLLKMAQYTIEYLLHSQDYLQSVVENLENKVLEGSRSINVLKNSLQDSNSNVDKYKAESKKRKKIIQQQQLLIESGASSFYQCPHCEKAFMNASFLQGHMQRRHPGSTAYIGDVIQHAEKEQQKLGAHIVALESELKKDRQDFELKLQQANKEKLLWEQKSQEEMSAWKQKEEEKWLKQVDELKSAFSTDIDNLKTKEVQYQQTIEELEDKLNQSQSNLGVLQDDYREEKRKIKNYGSRMKSLEQENVGKDEAIETLFEEIRQVKQHADKRLTEQDKRLKNTYFATKSPKTAKKKLVEKKPKPIIKPSAPVVVSKPQESEQVDFRENYDEMLKRYKPFVLELLDDKLNKCGVDPLARGIPKNMLTNKLVVLKKERQQKSKNDPNYYQIRNSIKQKLEQEVEKEVAKMTPKKKKKRSRSSPIRKVKQAPESFFSDSSDNEEEEKAAPVYSTPIKKSKKMKSKSSPPSPKLSEIKSRRDSDLGGSLKDDFSSPWDDSGDEKEKVKVDTIVPSSKYDDVWDDESIDSEEKPKQEKVKQLAKELDRKLAQGKPPPKGGGVKLVQSEAVQPFDLSDDDLFSVSSQEKVADKQPKPAPRNKGGTGSASGTSVWGTEQKGAGSTGQSTKASDFDDLTLSDLSM